MLTNLYSKIFLTNIIGNYEDVNRMRLLNYCTLIAMTVGFVFAPINLLQGKPLLSVINIITFFVGLLCFYLNRLGKSHLGFLIQGLVLSIISAYSAIKFRNGLENYIILNLCVVILFQRKLWIIISFGLFNTAMYLGSIYAIAKYPTTEALPFYRKQINYCLSLFFIALVIRYFKSIYNNFLSEINEQNQKILKQQDELSASKYDLQVKNQELQKFNSAKEKLFSIIAHDVKSPIIGLKSSLDLLNKNIISVDEFKSLSIELAQRVNQLQGNLDNLLQWSQSQMLGITAKPERCFLKSILIDCLGLLQQNLENKQLKIETAIPDLLEIYADPNHIRLILRNLISNAIKFSYTEHTIYIKAEYNLNSTVVSVRDTGTGMDEATTNNIFDAMQLNSQYGTANEKGTGLGLQMCKEFLEKNNGQIWVQSQLGKGSEFSFSIPRT